MYHFPYQMVRAGANLIICATVPAMTTRDRVIDEALIAFADRGFEATSLDSLARELGITKQAILYHFGSKDALMEAVIHNSITRLGIALAPALATSERGWAKVESVVRASFDVVATQPEVLGLIREAARLGAGWAGQATSQLEPLMSRASGFLADEVEAGRLQPHDHRILLLAAFSMVVGIATDQGAMRAVGVEPTGRSLVRARRELLRVLEASLAPRSS